MNAEQPACPAAATDSGSESSQLPLGSRIAARFRGIGVDAEVAELRGEAARPARLPS